MIYALDKELEIVRSVITNETNEISVCVDKKDQQNVYYTLITIFNRNINKVIAGRLAIDELFADNKDFSGYFVQKNALNLLFLYHQENKLASRNAIFAKAFKHRKEAALSFLAAVAETQCPADIGILFIDDININLNSHNKVYFNYFLDFDKFDFLEDERKYFKTVAEYAFEILSKDFSEKYEGSVEYYSDELRVLYRKINKNTFTNLSQIILYIKNMSDSQKEQLYGFERFIEGLVAFKDWLVGNWTKVFIILLVSATVLFLVYQISIRIIYEKRAKENIVYSGLEQIGDVHLGEEVV